MRSLSPLCSLFVVFLVGGCKNPFTSSAPSKPPGPPTAEQVCAHLKTVVPDPRMQKSEDCQAEIAQIRQAFGESTWPMMSQCLVSAANAEAAEKCVKDAMNSAPPKDVH